MERRESIHDVVVLQTLTEEYPFLNGVQPSIKKRFQSPAGLQYNTYLVTSKLEGLEIFVAKGAVNDIHRELELGTEWHALQILQAHESPAPALLLPEHKPDNFLLLEYIEGQSGAERIKSEINRKETFVQAGIAAGKLHTTQVDAFGDLQASSNIRWQTFMDDKIQSRLNLLPNDLSQKTSELYSSLHHILDKESNEAPVMTQRDMHLGNFLIRANSGEAVVIDYAYAVGGRPFSDISKLYIEEFYYYPEHRDNFLDTYKNHVPLPADFDQQMKLYIMATALGMIYYASSIENTAGLKHPTQIISDLVNKTGRITELIS